MTPKASALGDFFADLYEVFVDLYLVTLLFEWAMLRYPKRWWHQCFLIKILRCPL